MRKLFTGKFGRIPAALLATVLISVLVAGGVVAATNGGYVLWEGTSEVTVTEPITIHYGGSKVGCTNSLALNTTLPIMYSLYPGTCADTWFKIESASPDNLTIKAVASSDGGSAVTVGFFDEYDGALPDIGTAGIAINSTAAVYVYRSICANSTATPDNYNVSTTFTRE